MTDAEHEPEHEPEHEEPLVKLLDLFCGVGGTTAGALAAGFAPEDIVGVEIDPLAAAGHAKHAPTLQADLSDPRWPLRLPSVPTATLTPDILWSSFPCQAWSQAGKRLGANDPRNGWPWTMEALRTFRPVVFLGENVRGLTQHAASKGCKEGSRLGPTDCPACYLEGVILPDLRTLYPHVEYRILDAADYGVPQRRHRLILYAGPVPFRWPEPTHSGSALAHAKWGEDASYWRSVGIPAVGVPSRDEVRLLRSAPDGRQPWVTMRQVLGIGLGVYAAGEAGAGALRPPDESAPAVSTKGTMFARAVGGGGNPRIAGAAEDRNHRDLTDEPATTWIETRKGRGMADRGSSGRSVPIDEAAPTLTGPGAGGTAPLSLRVETGQTSERRRTDGTHREPIAVSVDEPAPAQRSGSRGAPELVRDPAVIPSRHDPKHPTMLPDEPAGTIRSGGDGHTAPYPFVAVGVRNLGTQGGIAVNRLIPYDEPSPTTSTAGDVYHISPRDPAIQDAPAPTVTTTEEKGTRASAASDWTMNGGPDRASDALWLATGRRRLTPDECAILQGFGPDLRATIAALPSKTAQYRVVGNAVPPRLAEVVLRAAREILATS